jgi:hypothetical protein
MGSCDEDLIRGIFIHIDAEIILKIPMNANVLEDFVVWNKQDRLPSQSAWHIILNVIINLGENEKGRWLVNGRSEPSVGNSMEVVCFQQSDIFTWKAPHGTIPAYAMLVARHISVSPQCPVRKARAENIKHLVFTCERARHVWKSFGIHAIIEEVLSTDKFGSIILEDILRNNR